MFWNSEKKLGKIEQKFPIFFRMFKNWFYLQLQPVCEKTNNLQEKVRIKKIKIEKRFELSAHFEGL